MESPRLELILDQDDEIFFPGETLSGSYKITGLDEELVRAVEVSVHWQTEGKGDDNLGVHYFWRREAREGVAGIVNGNWSTVLPQSPLSYQGVLFKIFWLARLRVFVRGKDFTETREFQLGNQPHAVRIEPITKFGKPMAAEFLEPTGE